MPRAHRRALFGRALFGRALFVGPEIYRIFAPVTLTIKHHHRLNRLIAQFGFTANEYGNFESQSRNIIVFGLRLAGNTKGNVKSVWPAEKPHPGRRTYSFLRLKNSWAIGRTEAKCDRGFVVMVKDADPLSSRVSRP
jgi:hypothetical protein